MKHTLKITIIMIVLFLATQLFGLATISNNLDVKKAIVDGIVTTAIDHKDTVVGKPPKSDSGAQSVIILTAAILAGTAILLLLMKLKFGFLFRYWYIVAVIITMMVTFGVYINFFSKAANYIIALILAVFLAYFKVKKRNMYIHNITEIFVYSGISVLLVSLFDGWLLAAFVLLIVISVYDMFAVWKSKHMIKIAKFQTESRAFAGLSIPYGPNKIKANYETSKTFGKAKERVRAAILGGGDIVFPLIFSGSVMLNLIQEHGFSKSLALGAASIISLAVTFALSFLLFKGKQDKFYPAMPYLTAGCFIGYLVILLVF
ncbi:hypothetical protein HYU09_02210 [Candidatus Woesearchaeota archaeon]|nr:hypothetical protein [Candidatus Woesearchaeota archaeon]